MSTPAAADVSTETDVRHRRSRAWRYRHSLWLLTKRDLTVRYATSALGYFWSVLDPLVMSGIYYFVFSVVFDRSVGEDPYIVFLLAGLLPWMWFNQATSDATRAFLKEAKLVRSTSIPRTIWVGRIVLSKGIEFVASIPVLVLFAVVAGAEVTPAVLLFPVAIVLQAVLTLGVALLVAPLVVFFRDLERVIKLVLRFLFYASPIIYSTANLPVEIQPYAALNPLSGIFALYRSTFFASELDAPLILTSALISVLVLVVGLIVFRRSERAVLKEL
ncbi:MULTISPECIES: ABC transporter permease [unclassified Rathayibacter]|uniref:ABC transporter permease n=1 Tax=unclassified Rathayibacter TaxID=2609250 RepID=UPI000A4BCD95|nr:MULTISPECIES: ABC transporter permease [unclassified Rathayibacter]